MEFRISRIKR